MRRALIIALAILNLANVFSANSGENEPEPVSYLNWNLASSGPKTLDPALSSGSGNSDVGNHLSEGLVREQVGKILPGIAESWKTSADGTIITFKLRDTTWSDGTALTAQDFEYSWKRAINPDTGAEYSWIWEYTNVVGAQEAAEGMGSLEDVRIRATDNQTLVVELKKPTDYFVSLISLFYFHPVKETAVNAGPNGTWALDPTLSVSNGPFKLTDYVLGDGLVMEKNENYWNADDVKIDIINVKFIDSAATAYRSYLNGEFDFLNDVPPAEVARLSAENPDFHIFPLLGTYFYNFNMSLEIWQDVRVRRALSQAIDREKITKALARGNIPATGLVPPGLMDHNNRDFSEISGTYGISIDNSGLAEAKALLADAGYLDGAEFPVFTLLYNNGEGHQFIAEIIQEMWKTNLGVECILENQEWAVFQDTRRAVNFDMARGGWIIDFPDPMGLLAIFQTGNAFNSSNYSNNNYDMLMSRANETKGEEHFKALYASQEILMYDLPFIPIYHYTDYYLSSPQIKNWSRSILGTLDFSTAYIER